MTTLSLFNEMFRAGINENDSFIWDDIKTKATLWTSFLTIPLPLTTHLQAYPLSTCSSRLCTLLMIFQNKAGAEWRFLLVWWWCDFLWTESLFSLQMFLSIGFAAVGLLGALYSLITSSLGLANGPVCFWRNDDSPIPQWGAPFTNRWGYKPAGLWEIS